MSCRARWIMRAGAVASHRRAAKVAAAALTLPRDAPGLSACRIMPACLFFPTTVKKMADAAGANGGIAHAHLTHAILSGKRHGTPIWIK